MAGKTKRAIAGLQETVVVEKRLAHRHGGALGRRATSW